MGGIHMIHVLFVCLGNICRSPMAEAVFRKMLEEEGIADQFQVDSAGIGAWHEGLPPHEGTRKILDDRNISYQGMKARQINNQDGEYFDYIIAMDEQNISDLQFLRDQTSNTNIAKLMDFVEKSEEVNVPDPYFTKKFDYTYQLIEKGCKALLQTIRQERGV
ncbi:low molecular weight protein-tyrosine-phosphatase YfkJ [Paraliobacillus ryukyuensis]|uniref:protein-tyrosine-phosphatase n=2 Tax=Paraliobacillus ryukyuensis TaxID=200904 RepID=A0A366DZ21_9BACI|nr:protein-tyrosine phosphatase [Paraliobacillus ryukyuensis]